jgi:hypothetical protein
MFQFVARWQIIQRWATHHSSILSAPESTRIWRLSRQNSLPRDQRHYKFGPLKEYETTGRSRESQDLQTIAKKIKAEWSDGSGLVAYHHWCKSRHVDRLVLFCVAEVLPVRVCATSTWRCGVGCALQPLLNSCIYI